MSSDGTAASDAYARFAEEVRDFLAAELPDYIREQTRLQTGVQPHPDIAKRWHRILFEKGWITPTWPKEFGGLDWDTTQTAIFHDECARAGAPKLPGMGLRMCASVLIAFGTEEQKAHFLPRIRSGEHYWCQGYSESEAGSDLASLRLRADRDGEHYVLNGAKIWTTHAHAANWIFLLARTSASARPQDGISFLLAPLDAPGIRVRPILSMSGEHELNEVFFENVRVPLHHRIGEENSGWRIAKHLLQHERGGGAYAPQLNVALEHLRAIARTRAQDDVLLHARLAELEIETLVIASMEDRFDQLYEKVNGFTAPIKKLTSSTLLQAISELALEMNGAEGAEADSWAAANYLGKRAVTIYGGAREVQKDLIARAALGL